jgi:hypothetical protein
MHRKTQIVVDDSASTNSNVTIVDDHRNRQDSQTGPMFYVENTLSRKGKLALVWLAAHWEKKLSRNQIVTADLVEAISLSFPLPPSHSSTFFSPSFFFFFFFFFLKRQSWGRGGPKCPGASRNHG